MTEICVVSFTMSAEGTYILIAIMTVRVIGAHDDELATVQVFATFQAAQTLDMEVVAHCRARVLITVNVLFALVTNHFLVASGFG